MESLFSKFISQLSSVSTDFNHLDNDFAVIHVDGNALRQLQSDFDDALTVEGMGCILMSRGTMDVEFNSENITVHAPALISLPRGIRVRFRSLEWDGVEMHVVAMGESFLQEINISFSAISGGALLSKPSHVMALSDSELPQLMRYVSLTRAIMADNFNSQLSRHMITSIMAAYFYQTVAFVYKRIDSVETGHQGTNRNNYVQEFMKLVHLNYTRERSVGFYASRLFISPKYLSLLVKEATGRSAARWIDFFVINEAKNLLRFSGKNIQQVAYALNFSNQSSFGKYFKHITGLSPTEFQKK